MNTETGSPAIKMQTLGIDSRKVTCSVLADGPFVILAVVRDAGHNEQPDRAAQMIGADIRRAFNAKGWAKITRDVYAKILAASVGPAATAQS
jgi:hypothetical protein